MARQDVWETREAATPRTRIGGLQLLMFSSTQSRGRFLVNNSTVLVFCFPLASQLDPLPVIFGILADMFLTTKHHLGSSIFRVSNRYVFDQMQNQILIDGHCNFIERISQATTAGESPYSSALAVITFIEKRVWTSPHLTSSWQSCLRKSWKNPKALSGFCVHTDKVHWYMWGAILFREGCDLLRTAVGFRESISRSQPGFSHDLSH